MSASNFNKREDNLMLPDIIDRFVEWDDVRGITANSDAFSQWKKLHEEILELGYHLMITEYRATCSTKPSLDQFYRMVDELISDLQDDGKPRANASADLGITDGIGDSMKALTSVSNLTCKSLERCSRHALTEIHNRGGSMDSTGKWTKS